MVLAMLNSKAQDYLIGFAGTGDTNSVTNIKVDNLTSGATVTLNGGDMLHLFGSVGIGTTDIDNGKVQIYPNPMTEKSTLTFTAFEKGNVVISIVDIEGKTVYQTCILVSTGINSFRVSDLSKGIYFVKVTSKNYYYSTKLISQSNLQSKARIEYISSAKIAIGIHLKSAAATIDMPYNDGDQLLFEGISGQYSTIVADVPLSSKTITFNFVTCMDADNNNYSIVQIGTQTWMAENLNVGVRINGSQSQINNGIIEKYCFLDLEAYCDIYGGLYQWNEMMQYVITPGVQGICPPGWHIPTDEEWTIVTDYLGGGQVAGGKMKSTGTNMYGTGLWGSPNTGATNESGFTAFPAGTCYGYGTFGYLGIYGYWWSSTESSANGAWYRFMYMSSSSALRSSHGKPLGNSVRCLCD